MWTDHQRTPDGKSEQIARYVKSHVMLDYSLCVFDMYVCVFMYVDVYVSLHIDIYVCVCLCVCHEHLYVASACHAGAVHEVHQNLKIFTIEIVAVQQVAMISKNEHSDPGSNNCRVVISSMMPAMPHS